MNQKLPVIAAFDFDGTLTYRDTLIPFLRASFGIKKLFIKFFTLLPQLAKFPLKLCSRQKAKEMILTAFLKGLPLIEVERLGKKFARGLLNKNLRPNALKRYQWHKDQGHICILISANLSFFLRPWAEDKGFNFLIASEAAVNDAGELTGELKGLNCYGKEKVNQLQELLGPKSGYTLYAYGDSPGDKELLELADHPFYRKME